MIDVTAAILVKDDKVLIAKRKPGGKLPDQWEFPGGKVEDDESARECLRREMREEFGIEVRVDDFLGESVYHYQHGKIRLLAYLARWRGGDFSLKAPADLPFVHKLVSGEIDISKGI
jgi:8-oxo-dGTP diphosphatase